MHSINLLEIPEIAQIIAGYLNDLEPCLTVCNAWRSLYLPYYWREVKTTTNLIKIAPVFDPIRHIHYREFVRVLAVDKDLSSIDQSLHYLNLRRLSLTFPWVKKWSSPYNEDPVLKNFINQHPSLECLDLHNAPPCLTDSAWTALVDHPRLEKVVVRWHGSLSDDFWRVCARLKTLKLGYFNGSAQRPIPKTLMLPSIRKLELVGLEHLSVRDELDVIAACPLLEDLVWYSGKSNKDPIWARFGHLATQGIWSHLQKLKTNFDAEDADLSLVIASMTRVTEIAIESDSFGPLSFMALLHHASTLQDLYIPHVMDCRMIRDVLCSFPRLEHLETWRIDAKDIAEGGPWVCTSLRTISVMISFSSEENNLQPVIFERISRLVHLENLEDGFDYCRATQRHGLIFRLQSGMAALANLSQLRRVRLDSKIQSMDLNEVRWIISHWKKLETIGRRLSQDISMRENLGVLLSKGGIIIE